MKLIYLKNFRRGFATNSSSTHSIIYKNKEDLFEDLNVFELDYYERYDKTIAASKEAKIKYIAAGIKYNTNLFDVMSAYYPQMKEYVKNSEFGMVARGSLSIGRNFEASVFFLKNVIENEEIVIVGGSDEEGWVYDTCLNHKELSDPDDIGEANVFKNGNYWVGYGDYNNSRLRFMTEPGECVPQFPELVDLKITDVCKNNCKFCYAGSTAKGKHADIDFIEKVVSQLSTQYFSSHKRLTEFAIGGGNPLEHPKFNEIVKMINKFGNIVNVTINSKDINSILEDDERLEVFKEYISGVGISVTDVECLDDIVKFKNVLSDKIKQHNNYGHKLFKVPVQFVIHLIPEMLGADKTIEILKKAAKLGLYYILFLGYKTIGRAYGSKINKLTDDELNKISESICITSIDTLFANTYKEYLSKNYESFPYTVTLNEGEFSMFIDAVNKKAYKSSYQLEHAYRLDMEDEDDWENYNKTWYDVENAFSLIRKDNGYKTYISFKKQNESE